MGQLYLYMTLSIMASCFSGFANAADTVKATDNTNDVQKMTVDKTKTEAEAERMLASERERRQTHLYVLKHRKTGDTVSFYESSVEETVQSLQLANIPVEKWHSCTHTETMDNTNLEDLEVSLDMSLLIESLAKIPAPELNDSQIDWVRQLSPCNPEIRLHLRALGLILGNYKLVRKPGV